MGLGHERVENAAHRTVRIDDSRPRPTHVGAVHDTEGMIMTFTETAGI